MKSNETLKEDTMFVEAVDRLELMKVQKSDMQMILMNRTLDLKIVVDHKKKTIRRDCIFRKNCASVPEERSAIPLQTEQSSAG